MQTPILTLDTGDLLVLVPDATRLPLTLEMVEPHIAKPRFLLGPNAYLVASGREQAMVIALAVQAAEVYAHVDLARETLLRLPAAPHIEHQARIRIAKVRASRLYAALRASFKRAERREEMHGRLLAFGAGLPGGAIASWQNDAFDTLTGWGDLERFRTDPNYPGDIVCKTSAEDGALPQWLRLPEDPALLLEHGLSAREREVAATVREAKAHLLGISERLSEHLPQSVTGPSVTTQPPEQATEHESQLLED